MLVLPLRGGCSVDVDGLRYALEGRASVFEGIADFVYLPVGCEALISSSTGAELALPCAEASRRLPPAYVPARTSPSRSAARGAPRARSRTSSRPEGRRRIGWSWSRC